MHNRGLNQNSKGWYELESVLVETDHTPPLAAGLEELAPNAAAAAIAFVTLAEAGQIDSVTAAEHAGQFETWEKALITKPEQSAHITAFCTGAYKRTRRRPDESRRKCRRHG